MNGQRTDSNYYTVDGVSGNVGVQAGGPGVQTTGSLPSATALGTTQSLVSVDALEEFRVQSSTYSAEYGRNPGGQFSIVTRSVRINGMARYSTICATTSLMRTIGSTIILASQSPPCGRTILAARWVAGGYSGSL